ncbi:polysaccharide biosynthesis protein [Pseudopedobacter saltans DSM 12145]|uniref:Polysaccharide biosynthesis protein n=1 Tax=Pseudopedobacter saltans (strain ATCC 51119 / DSM 12145 / JCM 21818 / CCUG 39354 / LMG 10337 / NBRC 100064 / NCIMB 13643) TaxID=762903 RepID=F0SD84_PSESL|nr:glycoside hydrolase family 99-like domain-containing protein [Pseudopedobacter saltans]ADY52870.1 polysaccharide biosynthesis protein [Pseudopedobacter saltans DSM 12145]
MPEKIRPIAIHLPQFHPFPENDEWWGKGFTEWTNVTKARPLFQGHYQPHLPADLGFYDLRLEEARLAQEALAKEYNIYGFCYYHYWFNGKRLMNEPIDRKLNNPKEDLPFMLCWANENWARTWDGADHDILIQQNYNEADDLEHINFLLEIFEDKRYIRINNKPIIVIYKSAELPNPKKTIEIWRQKASEKGMDLYICRMDRWNTENGQHILDTGFDASIDFQPLSPSLKEYLKKSYKKQNLVTRVYDKLKKILYKKRVKQPTIIDYAKFTEFDSSLVNKPYKLYPCVSPGWDNTARKKENGIVFINSTPTNFYNWTKKKIKKFQPYSKEENLLFINAWNEWAEGNHLEPCNKNGLGYLKALKKALDE